MADQDTTQAWDDPESLDLLARAVSDTGYWRRCWAHVPEYALLEIAAAQLWSPPNPEHGLPAGTVTLAFTEVTAVGLLGFHRALAKDWPARLSRLQPILRGRLARLFLGEPGRIVRFTDENVCLDELHEGPNPLSMVSILRDSCAFGSRELIGALTQKAKSSQAWRASAETSYLESPVLFAMATPAIGVFVASRGLSVHTTEENVTPSNVGSLHQRWWEHWKEYWERRGTPDAMPFECACEATIPTGTDPGPAAGEAPGADPEGPASSGPE